MGVRPRQSGIFAFLCVVFSFHSSEFLLLSNFGQHVVSRGHLQPFSRIMAILFEFKNHFPTVKSLFGSFVYL